MAKIVGIDVGTNSLGITVRDADSKNCDQIIYSTVHQFKSGVGNGKQGEFSLAAERTGKRGPRKLNRVRRYRKWATLKLLINHHACPLTLDELSEWEKYDKEKGRRTYPSSNELFENWIKCDFDGDGIPDKECPNPLALRAWLATVPDIDFSIITNRYKLGRALYHIAQRRGFKSSKGERLNDDVTIETTETAEEQEFKKSELDRCAALEQYRIDHSLPTVGCALFEISKVERVRAHQLYQPVRREYRDEVSFIFDFQSGLHEETELREGLLSEKKESGTIFYKRPLKSQKGTVGKCTLEPSKPRCPQSRPEFEEFSAWCYINNIRFGNRCVSELNLEQKQRLYKEKFIRATDFKFETIRHWIERETGRCYRYSTNPSECTINYSDDAKVESCCVTYRLKELLGDDWRNWAHTSSKSHTSYQVGMPAHQVVYGWEDVWHVCFNAEDEEPLERFAQDASLDKTLLIRLYNAMPIAYSRLSLKAIRNINRFLLKGMLYNEACLMAKLPDILGKSWNETIVGEVRNILADINAQKKIDHIVNALIANYKADEYKWAEHDTSYLLQPSDYDDIQVFAMEEYGHVTWNSMNAEDQRVVLESVAEGYQHFFASEKRTFIKSKPIRTELATYLTKRFPNVDARQFARLYHHSQVLVYPAAKEQQIFTKNAVLSRKLLDSPAISSLRNPMALRVLHTLRRDINSLLLDGTIDEDDTRIVIEVARELNDANMRWAIKQYQDKRRDENKVFESLLGDFTATDVSLRRVRYATEQSLELQQFESQIEELSYTRYKDQLLKRYKLWREQNFRCLYTGQIIPLSSVLSGNDVDIEHTLPRSLSFDDSMENQTLCSSNFNRFIKRNQLPSQLDNYEDILRNLQPWVERIERLKDRVSFWRYRARKAQDKDSKDSAIRQRHLWELELQYWQHKVGNFRMQEIKQGFRNNQLADTSTIARYATLFLKSLFTGVEVQKGTVTAAFRSIMGVPPKRRDNNSHHAVDALVLTYIPTAAQRDKLLKLYYEQLELKEAGHDYSQISKRIQHEKSLCGLDFNTNPSIEFIRHNVVARYSSNEQITTIARRKQKVGSRILWQQGDSIRGKLFGDNFYGKIRVDDQEKVVIRRNGGFVRFEEKHIADIIDPAIREAIRSQVNEKGFEQAKKEGFYIIGPSGVRTPIRHMRCEYKDKPVVPVKQHAYLSKKDYKQYSYAENGEVVLYALYQNGKARDYRCVTLIEVAKANRRQALQRIEDLLPCQINKGAKILSLAFSLHRGDMVILRKDDERLSDLSSQELSRRLYRFCFVENAKQGKIRLQHHLYSAAGESKVSPVNTFTIGDASPMLIVSPGKQQFWIENVDFCFEHGRIKPL